MAGSITRRDSPARLERIRKKEARDGEGRHHPSRCVCAVGKRGMAERIRYKNCLKRRRRRRRRGLFVTAYIWYSTVYRVQTECSRPKIQGPFSILYSFFSLTLQDVAWGLEDNLSTTFREEEDEEGERERQRDRDEKSFCEFGCERKEKKGGWCKSPRRVCDFFSLFWDVRGKIALVSLFCLAPGCRIH